MHFNPLAFIELFVVLAFAIAWAILEFVAAPSRQEARSPARPEADG